MFHSSIYEDAWSVGICINYAECLEQYYTILGSKNWIILFQHWANYLLSKTYFWQCTFSVSNHYFSHIFIFCSCLLFNDIFWTYYDFCIPIPIPIPNTWNFLQSSYLFLLKIAPNFSLFTSIVVSPSCFKGSKALRVIFYLFRNERVKTIM